MDTENICDGDFENEGCKLRNPNLQSLSSDKLYHLGLGTETHDLESMFGDLKFVCIGGSAHRMKNFAQYIAEQLNIPTDLSDITGHAHRYSMFKVGPVLSISHGIGSPSLAVMLDELFKLLSYAKCKNVTIIRIGTCGGIGVQPGSLVVTNKTVDGLLRPIYEQYILGEVVHREAILDQNLVEEVKEISREFTHYETVIGSTMCANDFYESQGRIDGSVCNYMEADKLKFLNKLHDAGVRNIDMECTTLAAKCYLVNIKCVIINVALINRLKGDQISLSPDKYKEFETRPQELAALFIKRKLQTKN
ncbi:uridine phosphorylase 2-like isoform X1 [Dinothrombium tinctorium]|uniref:Uridine phosphorylase 2-like isoform X1 n=1 Tax=Dinothrombium tinctorium TaxID=1965070 RepID=A0A3S3NYN5_9ACAR|nr:uridine phosphorylase 2-like isoform X1 [Dinothrombium tinctorium]